MGKNFDILDIGPNDDLFTVIKKCNYNFKQYSSSQASSYISFEDNIDDINKVREDLATQVNSLLEIIRESFQSQNEKIEKLVEAYDKKLLEATNALESNFDSKLADLTAEFDKKLQEVAAGIEPNPDVSDFVTKSELTSSSAPITPIYAKSIYGTTRVYSAGGAVYGCTNLYNNSSGTTSVTLSQTAANFSFLDIYFTEGSNTLVGHQRVYSPNGKDVTLSMVTINPNNKQAVLRGTCYKISATKITADTDRYGTVTARTTNTVYNEFKAGNDIKIIRVDGWK